MHSCMPQQLHHSQIKLVYAICNYGNNSHLCHLYAISMANEYIYINSMVYNK